MWNCALILRKNKPKRWQICEKLMILINLPLSIVNNCLIRSKTPEIAKIKCDCSQQFRIIVLSCRLPMRVLLLEDEPDLGAAIKRTLNQHKYVVDWALNGTEAWHYLDHPKTQYTLAIFDWLVPGLSGLDLLRRLRASNNPLPVLMLTAKDRMEDKVAGLDAGADDYLVKPFGMAELLDRKSVV